MMHFPRLRELRRHKRAVLTIHLLFFTLVTLLAARGVEDMNVARLDASPVSAFAPVR